MKDDFEPLYFDALLLISRLDDGFLELGSLLRQFQETSPHDFNALISTAQLRRRKGYYLVEIDRAFGGNEQLRPLLNKIGWTKLAMIAKRVTQDNREDLLQLAGAHTARNLQAIMRGDEPIIGGRVILLHFTWEQFATFSKAILAHGAIQNGDGFIGKEMALIGALGRSCG